MRGASRSSRTLRRDAVGVSMLQRGLSMPTNDVDAHGQVAWSWHPDADVNLRRRSRVAQVTVAKKPGAPGRTRSSRSNHCAGNAGCFRLNLWYLPPAFFEQAGHGCGQRPAFSAPSVLRGQSISTARTRKSRRETANPCPSTRCPQLQIRSAHSNIAHRNLQSRSTGRARQRPRCEQISPHPGRRHRRARPGSRCRADASPVAGSRHRLGFPLRFRTATNAPTHQGWIECTTVMSCQISLS